jgi:anti-sigma B factor antagonist
MSRRSPRPRQIEQPGSAFARTVSETSSGCAEPVTDGLQWHEWHATDASVLVVRGELDYWSGMELEQYLVGLAAAGHSRVVLDLAGLGFCDAGGIGVLVRGNARAQAQDGWLRLACGDPRTQRLLRIVNLRGMLPMFESVSDAVSGRMPGQDRGWASPCR